jgi:hypothetical protein
MAAFSFGFRNGKEGAEIVLALLEDWAVFTFALRILAARIVSHDRASCQFRQEPAQKKERSVWLMMMLCQRTFAIG